MRKRILKIAFNLFGLRAQEVAKDPQKMQSLLNKTKEKIQKREGLIQGFYDEVNTLYAFGKSYFDGSYRDVSIGTIAKIAFALIYFVVPTDAIPDFLLGAGFIDDSVVVLWSMRSLKKEVTKFKQWQNEESEKDKT